MTEGRNKKRAGLFGGSFNQVHVGHLRLCLEMLEQAGMDQVQLVPAHVPPHKEAEHVLAFDLRRAMLEDSIKGMSGLDINCMERDRPGPSYTYDTLKLYSRQHPDHELFFILGYPDLLTLPKWYRGMELAFISNLLVVGREGNQEDFARMAADFWKARQLDEHHWQVEEGRQVQYFTIPRLDISSSMIRARWLARKSVDWLIPVAVHRYLDAYSDQIRAVWE